MTVSFVANPAMSEGNETVAYDPTSKTLTFQIAAGFTNANDIVRTLNDDPPPEPNSKPVSCPKTPATPTSPAKD